MQKIKIICIITSFVGVMMISIGLVLQEKSINSFKIDSLATNTNLIIKRK